MRSEVCRVTVDAHEALELRAPALESLRHMKCVNKEPSLEDVAGNVVAQTFTET